MILYLRNVVLGFAILLTQTSAVEFPSSIQKCNAGDNECIARAFQAILQNHITGIPEIGLGSIDPLPFLNLEILNAEQGDVSVNLTMPTGFIKGWKDMQVKKVIGFNKDPNQNKIELHVSVPKDTIVGNYKISGKILVLPVAGNGNITFIFDDLKMVVKIKTKVQTRNGEDYLKIKSVHCDIDVEKMFVEFTNLFNDKGLSDNINLLLNQNAEIIFSEKKHAFGAVRGTLLKDLLNPVFEMFPYRMLFLD